MENIMQTQCRCWEPANTYFLVFFVGSNCSSANIQNTVRQKGKTHHSNNPFLSLAIVHGVSYMNLNPKPKANGRH